jgi:hypothetical protein
MLTLGIIKKLQEINLFHDSFMGRLCLCAFITAGTKTLYGDIHVAQKSVFPRMSQFQVKRYGMSLYFFQITVKVASLMGVIPSHF